MAGIFEKVSDYPRTSLLSTLSVAMAAQSVYLLSRRRSTEARAHRQHVEEWQEKAKRRADYDKIINLPIYVHTDTSNEEIIDRAVTQKLIRNLDPVDVIYPRSK